MPPQVARQASGAFIVSPGLGWQIIAMEHMRVSRRTALLTAGGLLMGGKGFAAAEPFDAWLAGLRAEARAQGISAETVRTALAALRPNPRVLELDRRQPERTLTWAEYRARIVAEPRIVQGRRAISDNRELLQAVEARFGVAAAVMSAIWGIESNYGTTLGSFPVVQSLATLAYDGRRATFFRSELINALRILDQGHIGLAQMTGSWAGAMGQPQFMPSSFLAYAVDFDRDGRRDIWHSRADTLASIGNYLARAQWRAGEGWGFAVRLPAGFDARLADGRSVRPLSAWSALGVKRHDGSALPASSVQAAIAAPDGPGGEAFALFSNAQAIRRYNNSTYDVLAVGLLSDLIAS